LGSSTEQDRHPTFCGICSLFQEMDRGNYIEEADRQIYLSHPRIEHAVTLKASGDVLTP
jgi:hypothetical protein